MSEKPIHEHVICYSCDSEYKLSFRESEASGFPKFCPFCGSVREEEPDDEVSDIDKESVYGDE